MKLFNVNTIPQGFEPCFDDLLNLNFLQDWDRLKAYVFSRTGYFKEASSLAYTSAGVGTLKFTICGEQGQVILAICNSGYVEFPNLDIDLPRFYLHLVDMTDVLYFERFFIEQLKELTEIEQAKSKETEQKKDE